MTKDELRGRQIAKKVMREMLSSKDHRWDICNVADRYVANPRQSRAAGKYVRIYCRQLAAALRLIK